MASPLNTIFPSPSPLLSFTTWKIGLGGEKMVFIEEGIYYVPLKSICACSKGLNQNQKEKYYKERVFFEFVV